MAIEGDLEVHREFPLDGRPREEPGTVVAEVDDDLLADVPHFDAPRAEWADKELVAGDGRLPRVCDRKPGRAVGLDQRGAKGLGGRHRRRGVDTADVDRPGGHCGGEPGFTEEDVDADLGWHGRALKHRPKTGRERVAASLSAVWLRLSSKEPPLAEEGISH